MPGGWHTREALVERLREGPLPSDEWRQLASSRKSLHVRINQLRTAGFDIASDQGRRPGKWGNYRVVTYRLLAEPGERLEHAA